MSLPEVLLWEALRRKAHGLRFRHQHPVGAYALDFYCPSAKLGIEIDGIAHEMGDNPARDARRDAWLAGRGYRVIRISADEVMKNLEGVVLHIVEECRRAKSSL